MKRLILSFALIFGLGLFSSAQELSVNGSLTAENGTVVDNYEVLISIANYYSEILITDENGLFSDLIELPGDITQGDVMVSVVSCNDILSEVQSFHPGNLDITFDLVICRGDSTGGGNDTIPLCENFFYYDVQGLNASFYGMALPENEEATYSWAFGDGASGEGAETAHAYASDGTYQVTLTTTSGDDCTASSFEFLYIGNDSTGGGNDTIYGCQNYFYYDVEGLSASFFGLVLPENDDATYTWTFGDGTSGEGAEIVHEYAEEGTYEVSLFTTSGGDCEAISYEFVFIGDDSTGGGGNDTIWNECENYFYYTANDFDVNFYGISFSQDDDVAFYWEFGDGSFGEAANIEHQYAQAGLYIVTLTTVSSDTCVYSSTQAIQIGGDNGGQDIWGSVFADGNPLDYGFVTMFSADDDTNNGDGFCYDFRFTEIDSMGSYFFENVPYGDYLILAFPDYMSAYFETHLPSYYGDTFFWEEATIISLGDAANAYDINLVPAEGAFDGECWIDGNLVGDNFKGQLDNENVTLILLDENNNPLEVTYSQANSAFDFSNINYGTYTVYAEITGLPTEPATITLTADNPNAEVTIEVSANGATTGLGDMPSKYVEEIGAIYPNPINTQAQIHMIMKQQSALTIHIYNQLGQLVQTRTITAQEGTSVLQIQTDNLSNGVYNLQIMTDDGASFIQKFIK